VIDILRSRSRRALEAEEIAGPGEPRAHPHDGDIVVRRPFVPAHRDDRGSPGAGGVAVPLDVRVMAVVRDPAMAADRLEHAQVRLVTDEVEATAVVRVRALQLLEELRRLPDGEHLHDASVLAEVA